MHQETNQRITNTRIYESNTDNMKQIRDENNQKPKYCDVQKTENPKPQHSSIERE